jgi:multiple sugar transport system permease protein
MQPTLTSSAGPAPAPARARRPVRRLGRTVSAVARYAILTGFGLIGLFPIYWMIVTSIKPQSQIFSYHPVWVPHPATLHGYHVAITQNQFSTFFSNSVIMTVVVVFGQLLFGVPAAYSFARMRYRGRDALFLLFLASLMVPPLVTMVPLFVMLSQIHWVNTWQGLIVPQIFSFGVPTLAVFFLRQFFLTLPREFEEAAAVDGAGTLRTIWTIILPNSKGAMVTVGAIGLVSTWNSFLWPVLIVNSTNRYPLTVAIGALLGQDLTPDWSAVMAGSSLVMLPMIVFFALTQRQFVRSIALSGVK